MAECKENGKIKTYDGSELYYVKNTVDNPKAVVLICHGLAEHHGRYDYLTEKLNNFGYNVYRYDQRGHGFSDGKRAYYSYSDEIFDDANIMVDFVNCENPTLSVFVLGHSMGGYTLVGFAIKYPNKVKGLIFSGPLTVDTGGITNDITAEMDPMMTVPNGLSKVVCTDPKVVEDYENDPLVLKEITVGLFQTLKLAIPWFKENMSQITYPSLILHGGTDLIVSPLDSKILYEAMSSKDKKRIVYENMYHEIFNEPSIKDTVINDVNNWISERI